MRLAIVACAALIGAAGAMTGCSDTGRTYSSDTNSFDRNYAYQDGDRYYHPEGKYYDSTTRRYYDRTSASYETTRYNNDRYWDTTSREYQARRNEPWYNGDRSDRSLDADRRYSNDSRYSDDRSYNDQYGNRYTYDQNGNRIDRPYDQTTYNNGRYNNPNDRYDYQRDPRYNTTYNNPGRRYEPWYTGDRTDRALDADNTNPAEMRADANRADSGTNRYDSNNQYRQTDYQNQQGKMDQGCTDTSVVVSPTDFVKEVSDKGKTEVELSRIAARQAESSKMRQFAKRMVDDHTKVDEELTRLASTKNITLSSDALSKSRAQIDQLSSLNGQQFDRQYMETMLKDHIKCVKKFEKQAQNGTDAEVRAFADKQLPTLREHLRLARDIARDMGIQVDDSQLSGVDTNK